MAAVSKREAQKLFEEVFDNMVSSGLFEIPVDIIDKELHFNRRTTALGVCKSTRRNGVFINHRIFLSEHAMEDKESVKNTLAHEIVHTMPGCQNHKANFKRNAILCKQLGYDVGTRASLEDSNASGINQAYRERRSQMKTRYTISCPECGAEWNYQRMCKAVKNPADYICRKCRCKLIRTA